MAVDWKSTVTGDLFAFLLMLQGDLPYQVAHTNCHHSGQYRLSVLGHPGVYLEVAFRVRAQTVLAHATTLHETSLRLKARDFNHPRERH